MFLDARSYPCCRFDQERPCACCGALSPSGASRARGWWCQTLPRSPTPRLSPVAWCGPPAQTPPSQSRETGRPHSSSGRCPSTRKTRLACRGPASAGLSSSARRRRSSRGCDAARRCLTGARLHRAPRTCRRLSPCPLPASPPSHLRTGPRTTYPRHSRCGWRSRPSCAPPSPPACTRWSCLRR